MPGAVQQAIERNRSMSKSLEPCWIDELICFDTDQRPRNRKQLKKHLPPIVYIEPTPEEAEFLRRERKRFDKATIALPTDD